MGGEAHGKPVNLLLTLPYDEPKELLDKWRHSDLNVQSIKYIDVRTLKDGVPKDTWKDATILVTLFVLPEDPQHDAPNLVFVHFISAGTNHVAKHPLYTNTEIPLTTSSGIHGPQISEWVIMTGLNSAHYYNILHSDQIAHQWRSPDHWSRFNSVQDKTGQRLGVLGYGSIGRQVGRVAKAMGMDVIAYTAGPRETPESRRDDGYIVPGTGDPDGSIPSAWYSGLDKDSLHQFLSQDIDWLVISVPLTPQTHHFISEAELQILGKSGKNAFLSNISRGRIIDQSALITSLRKYVDNDPLQGGSGGEGGIRGCALDVTDPEPLPPDHELWDAPNCIITPHISGLGSTYTKRALDVFRVNLEKWQKGEKLINQVDRKRGY